MSRLKEELERMDPLVKSGVSGMLSEDRPFDDEEDVDEEDDADDVAPFGDFDDD